jgi:hypothetical protein
MVRFAWMSIQAECMPFPLVYPWYANHNITRATGFETDWMLKCEFDSTVESGKTDSFIHEVCPGKKAIYPVK